MFYNYNVDSYYLLILGYTLLLPVAFFAEPVCWLFGQSNMHLTLDFYPDYARLVRKELNEQESS